MKELYQLILTKQSLFNQAMARSVNEYYYNETVWVKHKTSVLGVNAEPYWTSHQELKFNSGKYYHDLSGINDQIQQYLLQINQLADTLDVLKSKEHENKLRIEEQGNLEQLLTSTKNQLANVKGQFSSYIHSLTDIQRACLLSHEFDTKGAEFLIETISEKRFDPNTLATIAIDEGKLQLLNFAINARANLDACSINNKTLVQYAIGKGNIAITNKIIAATSNFDNTLLLALSQNDLDTIKLVLASYPELASRLLSGESCLLHYAIANKQIELITYMLDQHPESLKILNANGDSAIDIAMRTNSEELLSYISKHFNAEDSHQNIVDKKVMQTILNEVHTTDFHELEVAGGINNVEVNLC
jgi:hypothetical protein